MVLYKLIKQDGVGEVYVQTIHIEVCWHDYEESLATDARVRKIQKTKSASQ